MSGLAGLAGLSGLAGLAGLSGLSGLAGVSGLAGLAGLSGLAVRVRCLRAQRVFVRALVECICLEGESMQRSSCPKP